ncbi:MAG TPA: ATP-grasp domain-containing protein [Blastocatellia bacterium]|nr:ATP-grasp domain-containing protein [Blastocatellia bacterium]HMV84972.1 ATP-grasp domain-containing protein [Blastocatellia bacterium]HMX30329.1 ATP-grasp domain-containing protein [Blastocatellia bacterium]HMY74626.1 ATP-grasp domain-containing protein [Blastocatellia bacterium]HMZ20117.1 ATP-grasp domain-containing protein [Blastocatellia bacterium]
MPDKTILCMTSYEKGQEFLREAKRQGWHVILLTKEDLKEADWPRDHIDEIFLMPDLSIRQHVINAVSYLARSNNIQRLVALDEFDIEMAATLREHLRVPGMGETTSRYFRDKLAMRVRADKKGIRVPAFCHVLNYDRLREYMSNVPAPWMLKPRSSASAIGIRKLHDSEQLWRLLDELGDEQSNYVLEQFVPGEVFHVDSIVEDKKVLYASVSKYGAPPMNVAHDGGIFTTRLLPRKSRDEKDLKKINKEVIKELGLVRGVTHAEFIKGREDGKLYFLEIAARVGGANIAETIEAASGLNLWAEWAKIETATEEKPYELKEPKELYSGIIISLARQEWPDLSAYDDAEIVWRMNRHHHAGLIVAAHEPARVEELLNSYVPRFYQDFHATVPLPDKPTA